MTEARLLVEVTYRLDGPATPASALLRLRAALDAQLTLAPTKGLVLLVASTRPLPEPES